MRPSKADNTLFDQILNELGHPGIDFDPYRVLDCLDRLDINRFSFPIVLVGGTNGKGSVCSYLASILKEAGLKTGFYSSPHLISYRERFQINGKPIQYHRLESNLKKIQAVFKSQKTWPFITPFEALTLCSYLYFSQEKVDVAVIEVGLGGRLDATNSWGRLAATVITAIGFDHQAYLGSSISQIAMEKGGIIRPGVPVITAAKGKAVGVLKKIARRRGSPIYLVNSPHPSFSHHDMQGLFQIQNAHLAFETIKNMIPLWDKPLDQVIIKGFKNSSWPGRFDRRSIYSKNGPQEVILDGAHNISAIEALLDSLRQKNIKKVDLLFGVLKDKDYQSMVRKLQPVVDSVCLVPLASTRSLSPHVMSPLWTKHKFIEKSPIRGFEKLLNRKSHNPILVTGSMYLVGDILKDPRLKGVKHR